MTFRAPIPDVEVLYHALDVYVHAAKWEEFGMTVLEALACGVPTITGEQGRRGGDARRGMREFVLDDLTPEALAAALLRLARDPDQRARAAAAGPRAAAPYTLAAHGRTVPFPLRTPRKKVKSPL